MLQDLCPKVLPLPISWHEKPQRSTLPVLMGTRLCLWDAVLGLGRFGLASTVSISLQFN